MRQISGGGREKKAAGKEAQGAVKCRTRKKDGRTEEEGCLCVPPPSKSRSVGWWPEPSGKEKLRQDGKEACLKDVCRGVKGRNMNCIC